MKKCSSIVWKVFDRVEEDNRCVAVLCKLCDKQFRYFGNTTNCRQHLVNKHPLQWELLMNGSLDDSAIRVIDDDRSIKSTLSTRKRKYNKDHEKVRYSVSVDLDNGELGSEENVPKISIQRVGVSDSDVEGQLDEDNEATLHIIRQMHQSNPDEEWLEDEPFATTDVEPYEPPQRKRVIYKTIKREIESPTRVITRNYTRKPVKTEQPKPRVYINNVKDEYSVFGEYVANKLRKFKSAQTKGNIQQLVTTLLWQAEYGVYDNPESVKRVLLSSVQESHMENNILEISENNQQDSIEAESNQIIEAESKHTLEAES